MIFLCFCFSITFLLLASIVESANDPSRTLPSAYPKFPENIVFKVKVGNQEVRVNIPFVQYVGLHKRLVDRFIYQGYYYTNAVQMAENEIGRRATEVAQVRATKAMPKAVYKDIGRVAGKSANRVGGISLLLDPNILGLLSLGQNPFKETAFTLQKYINRYIELKNSSNLSDREKAEKAQLKQDLEEHTVSPFLRHYLEDDPFLPLIRR